MLARELVQGSLSVEPEDRIYRYDYWVLLTNKREPTVVVDGLRDRIHLGASGADGTFP